MATNSENGMHSFFEGQALFGRYRIPTLIAIVTGVAWAIQPVASFYALEPDVRIDIMNAVAAYAMLYFLVPFGLWLFFWAAFWALGKGFGARMRVGRLFKLVGWGLAPFALIGLVRAVGWYYAFQGETLPHEVRRGVMAAELRGYQNMMAEIGAHPTIVATTVASCVLLGASAYLWTYAVEYSTDLERRQTFVVVAVPTVLYVAYSIVDVLTV